MKFIVENKVENKIIDNTPNAIEQIKTIITTTLTKAIENKIDWDAQPIENSRTNFIGSIHVMNNAEWKAAKDILKGTIKSHPETEAELSRVLGIIDPIGNF